MAFPTFQTTIECPQCNQPLTTAIHQIVDIGESPALRDRLLRGRLNAMQCPRCGASGPIGVPMIYHDPSHSLLLAFVPQGLNLRIEEEEREVGRLTNLLLDHTPAEQRKGYMLNPTRVMTYEGLIEKILEAEGVDPDEMRKQSEKVHLIVKMAQVAYDDTKLAAMIEENRNLIDYNFLMLITVTMQQAGETHDEAMVDRYGTLREKIVSQLGLTADQVPSLGLEDNMDGLINLLLEVPDQELQAAVAANRPLMDYNFFMHLSQRAEQAASEEKTRLLALRKKLVDFTEEMDRLATEAMERASGQLQTLLQADDIEAKVQEMYLELDEAFLVVLSANVEQAKSQGRQDIVDILMRIYSHVVTVMENRLRPELRAVNQLLRMESAEERAGRLREELRIYNPAGFIEMVETIAADLENSGGAQPGVLDRLYDIADEARLIAATELEDQPAPPIEALFQTTPGASMPQSGSTPSKPGSDGPGIILP